MQKSIEHDVRDKGFKNLEPIDSALARVKARLHLVEVESIRLRKEHRISGRILAEDIYSKINVPNFRKSTMDGFAIKVEDTLNVTKDQPAVLQVVQSISIAEKSKLPLKTGTAIKLPTGGILPEEATGVIKVEDVEVIKNKSAYQIKIFHPVDLDSHISPIGEDYKKSDLIFEKNHILSSVDFGILLSLGIHSINVYKKLKIGIVATGNEIIDIETELQSGQVYESNSYVIKEILEHFGFRVTRYKKIDDDYEILKQKYYEMAQEEDVIIFTGGTSVGLKDFTPILINEMSEILVHGINVRPGSPTTFGIKDKTLVFGLPGFPVSAILMTYFFVLPILYFHQGIENMEYFRFKGRINQEIPSILGRRDYLRVKVTNTENETIIEPIRITGSSLLRTIGKSEGIVIIDENTEKIEKNSIVEVIMFDKIKGNLD